MLTDKEKHALDALKRAGYHWNSAHELGADKRALDSLCRKGIAKWAMQEQRPLHEPVSRWRIYTLVEAWK